MWEYDYGYQTIEMIRNTVDMYQLTVEGAGTGPEKNWCRPDNLPQKRHDSPPARGLPAPGGLFSRRNSERGGPPHEKTGQKTAKNAPWACCET